MIDTKIAGHTKEAVSIIREILLKDPENIHHKIESLGSLTSQMEIAISQHNHDEIGAIMTQADRKSVV